MPDDNPSPVRQNSAGLRKTLFETMDQLRSGRITPAVANATARVAHEIIASVQLELDAESQAKRLHDTTDALPPVLELGLDEEDPPVVPERTRL